MLALWLICTLNAAVAINIAPTRTATSENAEATSTTSMNDEIVQGFSLRDAPFELAEPETAVLAKYIVEKLSYGDPQIWIETLGEKPPSRASSILSFFRRSEDQKPEAASQEKVSTLKVGRLGDSSQTVEVVQPEASRSKFTLKADKEPSNAEAQTSKTEAPEPEVVAITTSAPAPKAKKLVMQDVPHYRNHGAAFEHVEPTANSGKHRGTRGKQQDTAKPVEEKRTEVQEGDGVFHILKKDNETPQEVAGGGFSLLRASPFILLLISIGCFTYHKFQFVIQMSASTRQGMKMFKAKQEDYDQKGFAASFMSSLGGGQQLPLHRSGNCDYGV